MLRWLSLSVLLIAGPAIGAPDDLESAFQSLKDAEAKKDVALVKKLAAETCALARQAASAPAPEDASEKEVWAKRNAWAKDIELFSEYSLYSTALAAKPAETIDLLTTLEQQNAKSKYLDQAYARYFVALQQNGAAAQIPVVAQRALANFPENEDALVVLADQAMTKRQLDKAQTYSEKLIAVLNRHSKPEGMSAADWDRKRAAALGRSYWIAGMMHMEKQQFYEANRDLRAALPLVKGYDAMLAPALFHLGVANYQLAASTRNKGQMLEAAKFSEEAANLKTALAEQAWRNAHAMRQEAAKLR